MAKYKDLLTHVWVEQAVRQRICHHSRAKHQILGGQLHLKVRDSNGYGKNYCEACAEQMIGRAHEKLDEMRADLRAADEG